MSNIPISIADPNLRKFFDYWLQKRAGRLAPSRADLDPLDLKYILPYILILEVVGTPHRYRVRLAGTGVVQEYGEEITGRFVDEMDFGAARDSILGEYEGVMEDGQPRVSRRDIVKNDGRQLIYERLILPLSSDGKTIDMLLGALAIKGISPAKRGE